MSVSAAIGLYNEDLQTIDLTIIRMDGYPEKAGSILLKYYSDEFDVLELFEKSKYGIKLLGHTIEDIEFDDVRVGRSFRAVSFESAAERLKMFESKHRAQYAYLYDDTTNRWYTFSKSGDLIRLMN